MFEEASRVFSKNEKSENQNKEDWKIVAKIIDHLFFVLYVILLLLSTLSVFLLMTFNNQHN